MSQIKDTMGPAWENFVWEVLDLMVGCANTLAEFLRRCRQHAHAVAPVQEAQENWQGEVEEPPVPIRIVPHPVNPARAQRFYAVAVGRRPGVYESWYEAAEQVVGYGGNVHRAFGTRAEAEFFLRANRNH
jgi:hypothetical protein